MKKLRLPGLMACLGIAIILISGCPQSNAPQNPSANTPTQPEVPGRPKPKVTKPPDATPPKTPKAPQKTPVSEEPSPELPEIEGPQDEETFRPPQPSPSRPRPPSPPKQQPPARDSPPGPSTPLDRPVTVNQWNLRPWPGANVVKAWEITRGDPNLLLAIVDRSFSVANRTLEGQSGCNARTYSVPEITQVGDVQPLKKEDHGTLVTQVAAACPRDGQNFFGVDWFSQILLLDHGNSWDRTEELMLWSLQDDVICGMANTIVCPPADLSGPKPDVINYSASLTEPVSRGAKLDIRDFASRMVVHDVVAVVSSGNDEKNADFVYPASSEGFITVGATRPDGKAASFSNWGESVDIMAPGDRIPLYNGQGKLINGYGTSFAAPLVSGVLLLAKNQYGKDVLPAIPQKPWNWKIARYILQKTAVPMTCSQYCSPNYPAEALADCRRDCCVGETQHCTPGAVDAYAALQESQKGCPDAWLLDADKYLIRLRRNDSGRYEGEFTLTARACASAAHASDIKLDVDSNPNMPNRFDVKVADKIVDPNTGVAESIRVVITELPGAALPRQFELHIKVRWMADSQLPDELLLMAILDRP